MKIIVKNCWHILLEQQTRGLMLLITCLRIVSILSAIVGATFIIPLSVALACGETNVILPFLIPMIITIVVMIAVNIPTRKFKINLSIRQTFLIVAISWLCVSLIGSIPLYFSGAFPSYIDAFLRVSADLQQQERPFLLQLNP